MHNELKSVKLFVYGTLRKDHSNHTYADFHTSEFIDTDRVKGQLYGGYTPRLTEGENWVNGEVFNVPHEIFRRIKDMEEGAGYKTKEVTTQKGHVVYCFIHPVPSKNYHYSWQKYPIKEWTKEHEATILYE